MSVSVHIYPLSKLVHASPADWERQLRAIESGKSRAFSYYQPLREAVVRHCKSKGKKLAEVRNELEVRAGMIRASRGAKPVDDNLDAFDVFVEKFYPRVSRFEKSLLQQDANNGCTFGDVHLTGTPHFEAIDADGERRYIFLLASKWEEDDLSAYLELLSVVIGERFNAPAKSLWCMDLRAGNDVKWRSSARVRNRCERAASLYARFLRAMSGPA